MKWVNHRLHGKSYDTIHKNKQNAIHDQNEMILDKVRVNNYDPTKNFTNQMLAIKYTLSV